MNCLIRLAQTGDTQALSRVIIAALRTSNAADYDAQTIARIEASFSAPAILALLAQRLVLVGLIGEEIVATASLEADVVRSVFVAPEHQGIGIGRQLMRAIERHAVDRGLSRLQVPSSITAEGFYAMLGYQKVRDAFHGNERTIVMHKPLIKPA